MKIIDNYEVDNRLEHPRNEEYKLWNLKANLKELTTKAQGEISTSQLQDTVMIAGTYSLSTKKRTYVIIPFGIIRHLRHLKKHNLFVEDSTGKTIDLMAKIAINRKRK